MLPEQNRVLTEVEFQLHKIGSANDAEDHQYLDSASQMRSEASASLLSLLEQNPGLIHTLPALLNELDTGHIFGYGWSMLLDQITQFRGNRNK